MDILDNAEFYSSMLVFLNAVNAPIKKEKVEILGHNKPIPPLDLKWMERLLQYILFEEMPYFMQDKCIEVVKEIEQFFKVGLGCEVQIDDTEHFEGVGDSVDVELCRTTTSRNRVFNSVAGQSPLDALCVPCPKQRRHFSIGIGS